MKALSFALIEIEELIDEVLECAQVCDQDLDDEAFLDELAELIQAEFLTRLGELLLIILWSPNWN